MMPLHRCCDGCSRRSERCHTDCAEYLAERVLAAHDERDRREREIDDYTARAYDRGGRRTSGKRVYKRCRSHWWRYRTTGLGK